jgi:fibronectin-binding autotransporter adhesin
MDTNNWDTATIPNGEDADVLIDGSAGQNTTVTYTTAVASRTNGYVTVEAGDSLRLGKSYAGSATFHMMGVTNRGSLRLSASATANGQSTTIISYETNAVFNAAGAMIEIQGATTGRNRVYGNVRVPFSNGNDGTILVQQPMADRNGVQFELSGTGAFVNNGLIHLRVYGNASFDGYYAKMAMTSADAAPVSSLLGTGRIWLDMDDLPVRSEGAASLAASATTHLLTNGIQHVVEGGGTVQTGLVNLGLIRASGTNGYLSIQNSSIDVYNGKAIINEASGRLVAAGPCGMHVGTTGSAPSQFLNYGLMEARTGSFISFRKLTTTSASKSTPATTMILEGTVAGGGQFINNFRPIQLASTATLSPGDLSNDDGTGFSTTGQITFVTNLILNATTALDFQLGRAAVAGIDYDSVAVVGSLTLDGVLNLSTLPGFGNGGTYTIFTCAPGGLTDNGLALGSLPAGFGEPQLDVDAVAGTVSLFFPPRRTVLIIR